MKFLVIAVVVLSLAIFLLEHGPNMILLHLRSQSATGRVLTIDRGNHMATTIRYRASGLDYEHTFTPCASHVGEQVTVFYDPENPMRATTEDPSDGLWHVLSRSVLGSIWLVGGWTVLTMLRNPKWRPWRSKLPT